MSLRNPARPSAGTSTGTHNPPRARTAAGGGMPSVTSPSATRRRKRGHSTRRRTIFSLAAGFLALSVGGCATDSTGPSTALATTHEATVAFESVDGPPPAIFQKLVQHLSHE